MAQSGPFLFEISPPDEEYDVPPADEEFTPPPVVRKKRNPAPAAGKTMFDLFPPDEKRSTSAVTKKQARTPLTQGAKNASAVATRKRPDSAEVNIANDKKRLRDLAVRLERQRQAQEAEARRLRAQELALNSKPSSVTVRERLLTRTDKTYARAESDRPLKPGPESIKCTKAKSIIEGFAFSNVEAKACDGETYLFSATRDNHPFSIKINSQTWRLTEVSKLKQSP
jgi:hypothetical protein